MMLNIKIHIFNNGQIPFDISKLYFSIVYTIYIMIKIQFNLIFYMLGETHFLEIKKEKETLTSLYFFEIFFSQM